MQGVQRMTHISHTVATLIRWARDEDHGWIHSVDAQKSKGSSNSIASFLGSTSFFARAKRICASTVSGASWDHWRLCKVPSAVHLQNKSIPDGWLTWEAKLLFFVAEPHCPSKSCSVLVLGLWLRAAVQKMLFYLSMHQVGLLPAIQLHKWLSCESSCAYIRTTDC